MSAYGIPYKGGKSKIVKWLIENLPPNEHFYDLFCGGCAVTHYAMLTRKWEQFNINDLNGMMPQMFIDGAHGKFVGEDRWISREEFFRTKDFDGYSAVCFSFGNDLKSYAYSKELEPIKKAAHYAIMFGEHKYLKELWGDDFAEIETSAKVYKRYLIYKRLVLRKAKRGNLSHLESLKRLLSLERLQSLKSLQSLQSCKADYQDVKILPNSTVYCDIPYKGTNKYVQGAFNYDRFYEWADSRDYPVFVSEYNMPQEFEPIAQIARKNTMCATNNNLLKAEKLFVQKRYADRYKRDLFI